MTEVSGATTRYVTLPGIEPERRMRFRIGALKEAQLATGRPFGELFLAALNFDAVALSTLLWAGLRHEDSDVTQAEADGLIDRMLETMTLSDISTVLADAVDRSNLLTRNQNGKSGKVASPSDSTNG